ncbi:7845_t:CDS:2 [Cetraspora pellucida]|uniref:7845_t:CDS:1 n=1 Tax=Cetraspora pellucida TaxID=1433469 RepID=A0A9N9C7R2_9GLOM|nr:7845_t:CDS:2 [Cetraspora pellucida]
MNVEEDVEMNIEKDVEVNVEKNVEVNVEENAEINVKMNVVINAKKNVEVNVVINAEEDVEVNVEKEAEEEIVQDLEEDSELNMEKDNENGNNEDKKTYKHLLTVTPICKIKEKKTRMVKELPKTTYYYKFGASGILINVAKETHKITSFFKAANASSINEVLPIMAYEGINQFHEYLVKNKCLITASEYNEYRAVYEYLVLLESRYRKKKQYYLYHGLFPLSQHSKHQKHKRLVDNEDIAMQCMYLDEYEQNDVVVYRKKFLEKMTILEQQMVRKQEIWVLDRNMSLQKKENGRLIMVSEFLLEECSQLKLSERVNNLLEQIRDKAISIFEAKFPNAMAIFAFDNSTNHGAYAEDTLIAARMNLKPKRNQPKM